MTDRELIELAAKAAGIELSWELGGYIAQVDDWSPRFRWNPLTSNSDAFRLAVKLEISILPSMEETEARNASMAGWQKSANPKDPCSAARRAVTLCAAEIGKAMEAGK
jgi:hypothetical protein